MIFSYLLKEYLTKDEVDMKLSRIYISIFIILNLVIITTIGITMTYVNVMMYLCLLWSISSWFNFILLWLQKEEVFKNTYIVICLVIYTPFCTCLYILIKIMGIHLDLSMLSITISYIFSIEFIWLLLYVLVKTLNKIQED